MLLQLTVFAEFHLKIYFFTNRGLLVGNLNSLVLHISVSPYTTSRWSSVVWGKTSVIWFWPSVKLISCCYGIFQWYALVSYFTDILRFFKRLAPRPWAMNFDSLYNWSLRSFIDDSFSRWWYFLICSIIRSLNSWTAGFLFWRSNSMLMSEWGPQSTDFCLCIFCWITFNCSLGWWLHYFTRKLS